MTGGPKAGNEAVRLHFVYDAWNRLVQVKADSGGQPGAVIATYQYDGRGFRTQKVLAGGDTFDYYYNEEHQVVEVRKNGDADAYEQYVWDARYIDAPVMIYRDTNTDGVVDQNLYVTQDANFNTTATLNGATGAVQNRFTYTPYGRRTVLSSTWQAATTDVTLGHQGLSLDAETGLYYNRARMLHPTLGTFTSRDPLGYVDGGSLYEYVRGAPLRLTDTTGLWADGRQYRIAELQQSVLRLSDRVRSESDGKRRYVLQIALARAQRELNELTSVTRPQDLGHSDFPGSDRFDYTLLDHDPKTKPVGGNPVLHFQPLWWVESLMQSAVKSCDRDAFQRAAHQGQDYFSHYEPGYRWDVSEGDFGHVDIFQWPPLSGGDVDDPSKHWQAFVDAYKWTQSWVEKWDQTCKCVTN